MFQESFFPVTFARYVMGFVHSPERSHKAESMETQCENVFSFVSVLTITSLPVRVKQ